MNEALMRKGVDLVTRATEADTAGDLHGALKLYQLGLEALCAVLRDHKNRVVRETLRPKVAEYMARAEQLKGRLASTSLLDEPTSVAFPEPPSSNLAPVQRGSSLESEQPISLKSQSERKSEGSMKPSPPLKSLSENNRTTTTAFIEIDHDEQGVDFDSIFGFYLDGIRAILIEDPFLSATHQFLNLVYLLEIVALRNGDGVEITVKTRSETLTDDKRIAALKKSLSNQGHTLTFIVDEQFHDRCLRIDYGPGDERGDGYLITLGRGLDIFQAPDDRGNRLVLGFHVQKFRKCLKTRISFHKL